MDSDQAQPIIEMKPLSQSENARIELAEAIALQAVAFLAGDDAYLTDFLSRTGISRDTLADSVESRDFLSGVLDHFLADESLLLAFCGNADIDPSEVWPARLALSSA